MALSQCKNADARGSTFIDVGREQTHNTTIHHQTINLNISVSGPTRNLHHLLRDVTDDVPACWQGAQELQKKAIAPSFHSTASTSGDIVAHLIIEIVQLLMHTETSGDYRILKLELESLQQTLTLVGLAVHAYEYTQLGRSLANIMNQELERCRVVLQELLDTINGYRWGLSSTRIHYYWSQVWWSGCDVDGLMALRQKLAACQEYLSRCLKGLKS
jgi:hypothetical protein